jgi:protein-tyrosine phosphatase
VPHIALQGAINVRDLGGIVTASGGKVLPGRLLRGDSLSNLTDADLAVLSGFGLRTVIDFRSEPEIGHLGADRLPDGARAVPLPIDAAGLDDFIAAIGDPARQRALLGDGKATAFMLAANREFVTSDSHRLQFARALEVIADPASHPVLFHCTAGKDRTGWMAAIVLTALGAEPEAVMADYLLTNEYVWPAYQAQLGPLAGKGEIDLEAFRPLLVQDPAYLDAAFEQARARYGGFAEFLRRGLSLPDSGTGRLRSSLLG